MKDLVQIYDTTLRDGTQAEEVAFTVEDKLAIAKKLDELGVHYIEAGWPGSNPRDLDFFRQATKLKLKKAKITAFGSTRKSSIPAHLDPNLKALLDSKASVITIFGKSWDFHVKEALKISLHENLKLIEDSIQFLKKNSEEVIYDAEHFFDGYRANPDYALKTLEAALRGGADWLILCETNGGRLPEEVFEIFSQVKEVFDVPLGIHCHNDGELGVANSLAAVRAGARQVHGTINGIGERCGNANLISIIPNLELKMGYASVGERSLKKLRETSHFVSELMNVQVPTHQAFVGNSAFAHKGGIHVSAVMKNPKTYEHINPEAVGNVRRVLVSDLSGVSNIVYKAKEFGLKLDSKDERIKNLLKEMKELENKGFQFEGAEASFEILLKKALGSYKSFFRLISFRVVDEKKLNEANPLSSASIEIEVEGQKESSTAMGHGPVNALDKALRRALERFYPSLKKVKLIDYKVRVLQSGSGTDSIVRVLIESSDGNHRWGTVGVSENIIQASWMALVDSMEYMLLRYTSKKRRG
ncbi:MAG: citramalate synthase [Deltaproteobacteria bacterium]|nr:citramalate synthase [Deltaproteobacteria bacterium]